MLQSRDVVQDRRFMGYIESGQSQANEGIPRFACNLDLNAALIIMTHRRPMAKPAIPS